MISVIDNRRAYFFEKGIREMMIWMKLKKHITGIINTVIMARLAINHILVIYVGADIDNSSAYFHYMFPKQRKMLPQTTVLTVDTFIAKCYYFAIKEARQDEAGSYKNR